MSGSSKNFMEALNQFGKFDIRKPLTEKKKLTKEQYLVVQFFLTPLFMEERFVLLRESCENFGFEKNIYRNQQKFADLE